MPRVPEGYSKDWPQISKRIIARANNRCEKCGIENGAIVTRRGRNKGRIVSEEEYNAKYKKFLEAKEIADRKYYEEKAKYEREWFNDFLSGELNLEELGLGYYSEGDFISHDDAMGFFDGNGVFHFTGLPLEKEIEFEDIFHELNWTKIVLQTHHKDQDKTNNHKSNLIALCQRCHGVEHMPKSKKRVSSRRA